MCHDTDASYFTNQEEFMLFMRTFKGHLKELDTYDTMILVFSVLGTVCLVFTLLTALTAQRIFNCRLNKIPQWEGLLVLANKVERGECAPVPNKQDITFPTIGPLPTFPFTLPPFEEEEISDLAHKEKQMVAL